MKLTFDNLEIKCRNSAEVGLKIYAMEAMRAMQEKEPEMAGCWTACIIEFDDLQPEFTFGSIAQLRDRDCWIYVEQPQAEQNRVKLLGA